jgi:cold shock protein
MSDTQNDLEVLNSQDQVMTETHPHVSSDIVLNEVRDKEEIGKEIGTCKWFNDKLGFGFITIYAGEDTGKDIFVHHSGIKPLNSNYRTLKKGEYINFNITTGLNGLQAIDVTGINGGPLMCDHVIGKKVTPVNGAPGSLPLPTMPTMPTNTQNRRPMQTPMQTPNQWQVVSRKPKVDKYNKSETPVVTGERKRFPPNNRPYKHPKTKDA